MFAALAVIVAFGVSAPALAQNVVPHVRAIPMPIVPHANLASATTALNQGIVGVGPLAPMGVDGYDAWPCWGGNADCSDIAFGGLVIGAPIQNWSLAGCTVSGTPCGQYYWTFEDDAANGNLKIEIVVKQGKNTLQKYSYNFGETLTGSPGSLWWISCDCVELNAADAVAGPATVTVTTTVGTTKITGKATINLE